MNDFNSFSSRDKAVLFGLYLSRFDTYGLNEFGFSGFREAYNVMGYAVNEIPKSIQNYRDEFDPYFPNPRKGWRNRKLRDYCKYIMDLCQNMTFDEMTRIVKIFLFDSSAELEIEKTKEKVFKKESNECVATRLITGRAAENYFVSKYPEIDVFQKYSLTDTTNLGCGFDYKLTFGESLYYVEVKGLNNKRGNILMTEKEHDVAGLMKERYCLFIVKNFIEKPEHQLIFNPLYSGLSFERHERKVIQVSYSSII